MNSTFDERRLAEYSDSELISHILSSPRIPETRVIQIILQLDRETSPR